MFKHGNMKWFLSQFSFLCSLVGGIPNKGSGPQINFWWEYVIAAYVRLD